MSESAPDTTNTGTSRCGDAGCKDGELTIAQGYGIDSIGRRNWSMKRKVTVISGCLLCVAAGIGIAVS